MTKVVCILALPIALGIPPRQESGTVSRSLRLEPGARVAQQIALGGKDSYAIAVAPGQFLRVVIEPAGVALALALAAPDGSALATIDAARSHAPASIAIEADAAGDYTLTVRAVKEVPAAGSYAVRVEVRAPMAQDRSRVAAERLMRDAIPMATDGAKADQAIETFARALALWREAGDRYGEAQALYWTGRAQQRLSRPSNAVESYERALAIDREIKARADEGMVLNAMGISYNGLTRSDKAIEVLDQAVAIGRELHDRDDQAMALNNMGIAYTNLSRNEKAIEVLEQALSLNRALKNRAREASVLNGLANANRQMNRYDRALEYYLQSAALHRESKNRFDEGLTLANVAIVYHQTGRYDRALEYYRQALSIHREVRNRNGEGIVLNNMGIAFMDLGRDEAAIESLEQALAIAREVKRRGGEANSLQNLGNAHRNLKRYEQALEYYEQALAMQREVKNRMGEGSLLNNLGGVALSLKQFDKAIDYSEQALAIAREVKERADEAAALRNLARAERDRGNLARARTLLEQDLAINESLRADIYNPVSRATYFASQQSALDTYIDVLMRLHAASRTERFDVLAFEASERARARSLLELLTEAGAGIRQGVDVGLLDRERGLAEALNKKAAEQVQLLARTHTPEQAAALNKAIIELESDYEQVQAQIRRTSPRYAAIAQPEPLALGEIQRQVLDPETLLLEYSLGEDRSYVWAVGTDSVSSHELPNREEIQRASREVLDLLTERSDEARLSEAARRLSEMVLRPVASRLARKRLLVVADGALQYVPFAMLPVPPDPAGVATASTPLVVEHEIVTLPSASTLAVMRKELASRKPAARTLALVADPVFSAEDARVKSAARVAPPGRPILAPEAETRILAHLAGNATGTSDVPRAIPRLLFTRQEAERIRAVAAQAETFVATDFKASKATVLSDELGSYRYVHFATHGHLDSERPGFSALVLSMVDEHGNPQDGFLRAHEIFNLTLPAELVVLSACQTGLGKEIRGEGLVGLTRGFMYAGAARVVVSLWSVSDKATSELMARFYEKMLKDRQRPAAALRAAQVEMWRQKQWQAPYYWAAFTIQGEWR
jgi:CHAT domain-containing protein/Tfp pilus assembly protein PilF